MQDEQPIQVVPLSREMKIDVVFEESQVQGSFKLTDPSGDVSRLDSPTLALCLAFSERQEVYNCLIELRLMSTYTARY